MDWKKEIDKSWTLFLDRDGVINVRIIDGYVRNIDEFRFLPGVLDALRRFSEVFGKIIIVTNQQGIGKGLMSEADVEKVHRHMKQAVEGRQGRIDAVYVCPQLKSEPDNFRKPSPKMAFMAKSDFPDIDFDRSIMVGDSDSDIEFGHNAGMHTVFIGDDTPLSNPDECYASLLEFSNNIL
ncbi:MAG: D-glycero-alpha-D-manno-heptose-1,7-bisphosphate 7-phosphatase [Candidatus Limimorpha sp.]